MEGLENNAETTIFVFLFSRVSICTFGLYTNSFPWKMHQKTKVKCYNESAT